MILVNKGLRIAQATFGKGHFFVAIFQNNLEAINTKLELELRLSVESKDTEHLRFPSGNKIPLICIAIVLLAALFIGGWPVSIKNNNTNEFDLLASTTKASGEENLPFYQVKANFNPKDRQVQGEEVVLFEVKDQVQELSFDLYMNRYQDEGLSSSEMRQYAFQKGKDIGKITIGQVIYQGAEVPFKVNGEKLIISPGTVTVGRKELKITFTISVPLIADRVGGNANGIWLGNWLPTLSYGGNGNKPTEIGDPFLNLSSTYAFSFTVPKEYNLVISNSKLTAEEGETKTYSGRLERVRDLPVFFDNGYRKISVTEGSTTINFYYLTDKYKDQAIDAAKGALDYYKSNIGEYPWQELNLVENDMYLSGMEYSTMILISTKALQTNLKPTIYHEVAHQWFYNLVGSDQIHAAFLDEGLAEFYSSRALGNISSRNINQITGLDKDINSFNQWRQYREIAYNNGRKLFENLYLIMGKDKFDQFIKEYYKTYKYSLVTISDFKEFLTKNIGSQEVDKLFR